MEDIKKAIEEKAAQLEGFAYVMETLLDRERWFQHTDEETGAMVDDEGEYAKARLAAIRETMKAVKKLAGV